MSTPSTTTLIKAVIVACLAFVALPVASASAGRIVATGHDVDDHCDPGDGRDGEQCGFMRTATEYVRATAPDPSRQVMLLDCSTEREGGIGELEQALNEAFTPTVVPRKVFCPSDPADGFAAEPLTTDVYSAIIVGTSCSPGDDSLNQVPECEVEGASEEVGTPDSFEINKRADDIADFFNADGGLFVMSGQNNGDGDPSTGPDTYYDFVPLGLQGAEVNPPFCLTPVGIEIGFEDQACPDPALRNGTRDDINCCPTHNSFAEPPAESALEVAERDSEGFPETLIAEGRIEGGEFVPPDEPQPDEPPPDEPDEAPPADEPPSSPTATCKGEPATIVGTEGPDELVGTPGPDVILGLGGDDVIRGLGGDDLICAGDGDDLVRGGPGDDRIFGGRGDDRLFGGRGADLIRGGQGDDVINGRQGNDVVGGGPGNDVVGGGPGNDVIRGGKGNDVLRGGRGNDRINGGRGNNVIRGGTGNDVIRGRRGNDVIRGGKGNDRLFGDRGNDRIFGGPGDDVIRSGRGRDRIFPGIGTNGVVAVKGRNRIECHPRGRDTVITNHASVAIGCDRVIRR